MEGFWKGVSTQGKRHNYVYKMLWSFCFYEQNTQNPS